MIKEEWVTTLFFMRNIMNLMGKYAKMIVKMKKNNKFQKIMMYQVETKLLKIGNW